MQTINLKPNVFKKLKQAKIIEEYEEKDEMTNSEFVNIMIDFKFRNLRVDKKKD